MYCSAPANLMDARPEIWDIIKIVFPKIKAQWKFVAFSMKYDILEVNGFENDSSNSNESCLELFKNWLQTDRGITPKTWCKLIERIKDVEGLKQAAESIEEELKKLPI